MANGVVYFSSATNGNVFALNASTGAELWSYVRPEIPGSSPTIVDGVVYFSVDLIGTLLSLRLRAGQCRSRSLPADAALFNDGPSGRPAHLYVSGMEPRSG